MSITYRGVVYPSQCDFMGHLNVQHYIAAFDQAILHLTSELGLLADRTSLGLGRRALFDQLPARTSRGAAALCRQRRAARG